MSTAYTLRAGPTRGRIDASGIDDLGVYEIKDSRITVEDYDAAKTLVDRYSHVEWLAGDPGAPEEEDDSDAGADADDSDGEHDDTAGESDSEGEADAQPTADSDDAETDAGDAESETSTDDEADTADADAAAKTDLDAVDLESLSYRDLQDVAQEYGIKANQSSDDLIAALRDIDHADD